MTDARAATEGGIHSVALALFSLRRVLGLVLAGLLTAVPAPGQNLQPPIKLLSQTVREMGAEGRSEAPVVNLNGLVSAYSSNAIDLVSPPLPVSRSQMYARDIELIRSELVSKNPDGTAGNRPSQDSGFPGGISGDGRFVAFSSRATNLVPEHTDAFEDIFVYDRAENTVDWISRGIDDAPSNGTSSFPKISADGRYVVFQSTATNLVEPITAPSNIYLFDRSDRTMRLVSVASDGTPADAQSITPNISDDGRVVAFASRAANLSADPVNGRFEQIFVHEWESGATSLVSLSSTGAPGNAISFLPDLNGDGSQVAFKSEAFNLVPGDTNGVPDVFVRDRPAGTTQRVSVDSFGNQSNGLSGGPGMSADARFVAFASFASNFVPEDGNGQSDVYVYDRFPPDREMGVIARVSVGIGGTEPDNGVSDFPVSISADGRWIGFASSASNLVPNDLNNDQDAFLACNPFDEFECAPPTPTPSVTATATPTVGTPFCVGDCNGDGQVTIDDLIRMVNIALGLAPICPNDVNDGCLAGDANCDCEITVDEIIRAVNNSLQGCHDFGDCTTEEHVQLCCENPSDTRTPTATRTITPTPPTPTATPTRPATFECVGDCGGNGEVTIEELIRMVNIALGLQTLCPGTNLGCLAGDAECDCQITVDDIIKAVNNSLNGCSTFVECSTTEHVEMCCEG